MQSLLEKVIWGRNGQCMNAQKCRCAFLPDLFGPHCSLASSFPWPNLLVLHSCMLLVLLTYIWASRKPLFVMINFFRKSISVATFFFFFGELRTVGTWSLVDCQCCIWYSWFCSFSLPRVHYGSNNGFMHFPLMLHEIREFSWWYFWYRPHGDNKCTRLMCAFADSFFFWLFSLFLISYINDDQFAMFFILDMRFLPWMTWQWYLMVCSPL